MNLLDGYFSIAYSDSEYVPTISLIIKANELRHDLKKFVKLKQNGLFQLSYVYESLIYMVNWNTIQDELINESYDLSNAVDEDHSHPIDKWVINRLPLQF